MKRVVFAALVSIAAASCNNTSIAPGLRPVTPVGSGERPDAEWTTARLREAVVSLRAAFVARGADAHRAARLRPDEVSQLYTESALTRIQGAQVGTESTDGEARWVHFRSLGDTPLVGFCARGARIAERNGPDGLRAPALVVDRLLIVGAERDALWGSWVEGLLLTENGWRLSSAVPYGQQVEDPRREHADVQLWECDLGERPNRDRPLAPAQPAVTRSAAP
ncbi:MAG: hypothetical protein JNK05_19465 [Myxococcales bacterium]|nr:hypothetical protein [Myxococcales bacterium]